MKCSRCKVTLGLLVLIAGVATLAADKRPERVEGKNEAPAALDAERIGKAAGATASTTADGVVRVGWARTDVKVTVDGIPLKPFAGLGSWAGDIVKYVCGKGAGLVLLYLCLTRAWRGTLLTSRPSCPVVGRLSVEPDAPIEKPLG